MREFRSIQGLADALFSLGFRAAESQFVFVLDQYAHAGEQTLTGTGFLEKYSVRPDAFLSNSEFDDRAIQDKIRSLKARLIPKPRLAATEVLLMPAQGSR